MYDRLSFTIFPLFRSQMLHLVYCKKESGQIGALPSKL